MLKKIVYKKYGTTIDNNLFDRVSSFIRYLILLLRLIYRHESNIVYMNVFDYFYKFIFFYDPIKCSTFDE